MAFCSKCGAAIAGNASFCQTCGTPVNQSVAVAVPGGIPVSPHAGVGAIVYASNVAYAGFWLRLVALLIDSVIIGFGALVLIVPLFFLMGGVAIIGSMPRHGEEPNPAVVGSFLMLIFTLVGLGLPKTPGKPFSGSTSHTWRAAKSKPHGVNRP